jgi:hypothetical protein
MYLGRKLLVINPLPTKFDIDNLMNWQKARLVSILVDDGLLLEFYVHHHVDLDKSNKLKTVTYAID